MSLMCARFSWWRNLSKSLGQMFVCSGEVLSIFVHCIFRGLCCILPAGNEADVEGKVRLIFDGFQSRVIAFHLAIVNMKEIAIVER